MTVNDTTNSLTTRIIFGKNKNPQNEFNYRDLSKPIYDLDEATYQFLCQAKPDMMSVFHGKAESLLPYFPGYEFKNGKSTYKGFEVGEGGFVYAEPGVYGDIRLLDIVSMHPNSMLSECIFGPRYTSVFKDIVDARVCIKHENWDVVNKMLDGKLAPFVQRVLDGKMTSKSLANALKTAINSVYGLTDAGFSNPFRDPRNVDNIVAKRGALFMIDLLEEVQALGYTVVHIKTDSIKIADADDKITQFVMDFGKRYGYEFEHEATYEKLCLVNNAVYVAQDKSDKHWTATGTQFQVPYVFKTLFTHEPIVFDDLCETKSVSTALYLDMNEGLAEGKHNYRFVGKVGQFCPMLPNSGGGELVRLMNVKTEDGQNKYAAATGSSGYRWLPSEEVKMRHLEDQIDHSYYAKLVDDARRAIFNYADDNWFCSNDPYVKGESCIWPF